MTEGDISGSALTAESARRKLPSRRSFFGKERQCTHRVQPHLRGGNRNAILSWVGCVGMGGSAKTQECLSLPGRALPDYWEGC